MLEILNLIGMEGWGGGAELGDQTFPFIQPINL